jgi:hypothetical protein
MGNRRLFALVTEVEVSDLTDKVTELPSMRLLHRQWIIGLPVIKGQKMYVVPTSCIVQKLNLEDTVAAGRGLLDSGSGDNYGTLLHCTWDISFL